MNNGDCERWTDEKRDRLAELWLTTDLSQSQIAKAMRVTKNAVVGQRRRMHLPSRQKPTGPPLSDEEKKRRQHRRIHAPKVTLPSLSEPQATVVPMPKPRPKPPSPPPQPAAPLPPAAVARTCCWPTGERPWRFCEEAVTTLGAVYCPVHRRMAIAKREIRHEDDAA